MIELNNLYRKYYEGKPSEVVALRGINFVVNDGDMVAIMGPLVRGSLHCFMSWHCLITTIRVNTNITV